MDETTYEDGPPADPDTSETTIVVWPGSEMGLVSHEGEHEDVAVVLPADPEPWTRRKGESRQAFHAFGHYRDLPISERSILAAERQHRGTCLGIEGDALPDRASSSWRDWCGPQGWYWVQRVEAWDAHLDDLTRRSMERRSLEVGAQALDAASTFVTLAEQSVRTRVEGDGTVPGKALTPFEAARLAEVGGHLAAAAAPLRPTVQGTLEAILGSARSRGSSRTTGD